MKTLKDDKLSILQNVYLYQKEYRFALTVLSGFTLDEVPELLDDSDLWDKVQAALGKKGVFDLAMPKPRGEALVVGKCFAPDGQLVSELEVSFRVGPIHKRLIVYGDRVWKKTAGALKAISKPEAFAQMDMSWENAFGGLKSKRNPDGKGMAVVELPTGEEVRPLPNVENPDKLVVSHSDRPGPAGFSPLGLAWPARLKNLGTYDKKWLREDWPGYPDDFDFGYFNVAPADQRIENFLSGDENIEVESMHPDKPRLRSQVPGIRPRGFINSVTENGESFEEISLKMDTVWLLPNQNTGIAIWRGETAVSDDEATQVSHILAFYDQRGEEPKPLIFYQDKLKEEPEEEGPESPEEKEAAESALAAPVVGMAGPLAAAGAGAADLTGQEPDEAGAEAEAGEESAEVGAEAAEGEGPEPAGAESAEGELTEDEKNELRAIFKERGIDFDEVMAARDKAPKEMPEAPPSETDPYNFAKLDPKIWDLERDEFEKELTAHFEKQGIKVGGQPTDQELQLIKEKQLEVIRDWKKICVEQGIDDPEILAEFDAAEAELMKAEKTSEIETEEAPPAEAEEPESLGEGEEERSSSQQEVQDKLAGGESLAGADLTGAELKGMDLSGQDLQGCNLSGAVMENVNLSNVNLEGAVLSGAILTDAILTGAKLKEANLAETSASGSNLARADLSGADLSNADLYQADLSEADLTGANLKGANLGESNLKKANCTRIQGEGVQLIGADLTEADFQEANLKSADLSGASIDKVNFEKAELGGARLYEAIGKTANFKDADLHNSRSDGKTRITEADFCGVNLTGVAWNEADFQGTNFSGADLSKGSLLQCNLGNTNFHRVIAKETNFSKCNFSQSNLTEVNLFKGSLRKADLTEADLSRSNLYSVDFYLATLQDTLFEDANINKTLLAQSQESGK